MNRGDSPAGIGVLGAGAWGTALAQIIASDGTPVHLWAREPDVADMINDDRVNQTYLPGIPLASSITASSNLGSFAGLSVLLGVVPAQHLGGVIGRFSDFTGDLVLCAKGIEAASGRFMSEVAVRAVPRANIAVLSGPTFAHEVAAGLPTAVTLACAGGRDQWRRLAPIIARPHFRPYYSEDVIGTEVGGAVKNVLAIACGVVDGLKLGQNARAALIARGFAEMARFAAALGARGETLSGLGGMGDLVLTCSSPSSRNFSLGIALAQGLSAKEALAASHGVAEGAHTALVLRDLARKQGVDMPIVGAVCDLLAGSLPADVVQSLLERPLKAEQERAPS